MAYRYRLTLPKSIVLRRHKRAVAFLLFLLLILIVLYLVFMWYVSNEGRARQPQTDIRSATYQPLQTFNTPYFSFEADNSWSFVEKESSQNTFVYRSSKKGIVSRDLSVYVDSMPQNQLLTRVLPVEANGSRFATDGIVSEHCREYLKDRILPGNNNPIDAVVETVSISCQVDGTSHTVGTGQKNGGLQVKLTGENGTSRNYYLLYHDLEFTPRLSVFTNIVNNFKAL